MPRTVYHPDSGAFEVYATEDEKEMDNLRKENKKLREQIAKNESAVASILKALGKNGISIDIGE